MEDGLQLEHIGYAVQKIEEYLVNFFVPLFRPEAISPIVEDATQRVRVAFVTLPGGGRIELIEPLDEVSPVSNLLRSKRGGLYHLCYVVERLDQAIERFREKGCLLICGPTPAQAFDGRRIAFFCTPQNDIVELVERQLARAK